MIRSRHFWLRLMEKMVYNGKKKKVWKRDLYSP